MDVNTEEISYFIYKKMERLIENGLEKDAIIVKKAAEILFPNDVEIVALSYMFTGYRKAKKYRKAIEVYNKAKRPFWDTLGAVECYEKLGLRNEAIREYEYLLKEYARIPLGPFPYDLYKLGALYFKEDAKKSRRYLEQSLLVKEEDKRFTTHLRSRVERLLGKICAGNGRPA